MIDAILGSVIVRSVLGFFKSLPQWYKHSILGKISHFFSKYYENSRIKSIWDNFIDRESGVYKSLYARVLRGFDKLLLRLGERLLPLVKGSMIVRFITWIWARISQVMLVVIGLYLPVDWLLRDILKLGTVASIWDEGFFVLCFIYIVADRLSKRRDDTKHQSHITPLDIPILLFVAVGFMLMCVNSPVLSIAIAGYRATVQYMLWFFISIRLIRSFRDATLIAKVICVTAIAVALHGIFQYIIGAPIPAHWVSQAEAGVRSRAYSIMGSPNILGAYIVMTAPIIASFAYSAKAMWKKVLAWCFVGVLCLCLLVTFSRGAWVGMCVAVVVFAILQDRRLFAPLLMAVPVAMFIPSIANRITFLFTDDFATASAVGGRALRWAVGKEMMATNPFIGFGLGRFGGAVAMQNQILEVTDEFSYFYMDNYYLKIGAEMGYTGLITFILLMVCLVIIGLRCVGRSKRCETKMPLATGIYAGLAGIITHCYFENIFEEPYMMALFWSLSAVLMYIGYIHKEKTGG